MYESRVLSSPSSAPLSACSLWDLLIWKLRLLRRQRMVGAAPARNRSARSESRLGPSTTRHAYRSLDRDHGPWAGLAVVRWQLQVILILRCLTRSKFENTLSGVITSLPSIRCSSPPLRPRCHHCLYLCSLYQRASAAALCLVARLLRLSRASS